MDRNWSGRNDQFLGELMSQLSPTAGQAQAIAAELRAQILAGTLPSGARLPSTRGLAAERGVSRGTVTAAYEQLLAEGYLRSRPGARAVVAPGLRAAPPPAADAEPRVPGPLSAYGSRLASAEAVEPPRPALADFRFGDLAAEDFPLLAWKRALLAALPRRPAWVGYGAAEGQPALRAALAAYLWRARGLRCTAEQIVVVNGSQQGIDLCARLAVDQGAAAVVEDPGYARARDVFRAAGASLLPVPVDQDGLMTDALPAGGARIVHLTPSHQFPLGGVLPAGRRAALVDWAAKTGAWVLEDDHDSEFRYDIAPIPPLAARPGGARVIYLGTISKTLSPGLRLGYLVPPPELVGPLRAAKRLTDRHAPTLEQEALAALIAGGGYEAHLRRIRRRHAARRAALLAALRAGFGARVRVQGAAAGLHVVVWFAELPAASETGLVTAARAAGVGLYPVGPLYVAAPRPDCAGVVMGYGGLAPERITAGVTRLAEVLAQRPGGRASRASAASMTARSNTPG